MSVFTKPVFVIYIPRDLSECIDELQESLDRQLKGYEVLIVWDANGDFKYRCEVLNGTIWNQITGIIKGLFIRNKIKKK